MKTLLIMRHGKSSWKNKDQEDHERPLAKRGQRDTRLIAEVIEEKELVPQKILVSSAARTIQTAEVLADELDYKGEIVSLDSLYLAEDSAYIQELKALPDDIERVLVIGHNPGLEALLQELSGQMQALGTAVTAFLSLPINSWGEINGDVGGELIEIWRPKEVRTELDEKADEEKKKAKKDKKSDKKK